MSVLTPPDPLADDRGVDPTGGPAPSVAPTRYGDLVDELRRRALGIVAVVGGVGLVGLLVITVGGAGDQQEDLATAPPSVVETPPADEGDQVDEGRAAGGAPVPADAGVSSTTVPAAETTTSQPSETSNPPETAAGPPTTSGGANNRTATTAAPLSTASSTTIAESTTTPTSPSTTVGSTAAPTTATTVTTSTTAAPTTPPPTTASTTTAPPGAGTGPVQQQILNLVNAERAQVNCGPLTLNGQLSTAAAGHSNDMAANGYFSHTGLDGSQPWDRARAAGYSSSFIGENIAQGYGSAEAVMNGWMNSSGHRANILNCGYQHLGVGLSNQGNYWTQLFGGG